MSAHGHVNNPPRRETSIVITKKIVEFCDARVKLCFSCDPLLISLGKDLYAVKEK